MTLLKADALQNAILTSASFSIIATDEKGVIQLFNVGAAVFYDMGATWGRDPLGAPSRGLLRDVGFGLRLGNSRSALGNVLHIDIAYPLDGDSSINDVQFLVETRKSF